jgi:septal ring factor EnvC (AmiA/AmiB activator)
MENEATERRSSGMNIIPARAPVFEWNFNTIISGVTLIAVLLGGAGTLIVGGYKINDLRRDVEENKERRLENTTNVAANKAMIDSLGNRITIVETTLLRLSDRISRTEAQNSNLTQSIGNLQKTIGEQSGDIKVIAAWVEDQRRRQERIEEGKN